MTKPADRDAEAQRVGYLIALFIQGTISPEEHDELDAWVGASDENMKLFEELTDEKNIEKGLAEMEQAEWKESSQKLLDKAAGKREKRKIKTGTWLIAASLILVVGLSWWFINRGEKAEKPKYALDITGDRQPGGNKALLTLANGAVVVLDSAHDGNLAIQGNVQVIKTDSALSYNHLPKLGVAQEVVYNTLSTPKGGQYALTLADGTRVWLNAGSSVKFPTAFIGKKRAVEITGEAYFEVAHNPAQPFNVMADGATVQVLGTHFNINAYQEEENLTATLVEGSIKLTKASVSRVLKPNQQATVDKNNNAILVRPVDAEEVVAWKEGMFVFLDADIGTVARQLGRWYNIDVAIKDTIAEHFNATIPRTLPLSKVLQLLEKMGLAHFKLAKEKLEVVK